MLRYQGATGCKLLTSNRHSNRVIQILSPAALSTQYPWDYPRDYELSTCAVDPRLCAAIPRRNRDLRQNERDSSVPARRRHTDGGQRHDERGVRDICRDTLIKHACKLPQELYKSLTWDRGSEMAEHHRFTVATDIQVYFCDPQHPWQRGSNENTNGLLRQYLPKGIDLSVYSQAKLNTVARRLNERPRKTLGYETPAQRFLHSVASTG